MSAAIFKGGAAAKAAAMDLAMQAHAADDPIGFARGVTTMLAGTMASAIGHEAVMQILRESETVVRAASVLKKSGHH